MEGVEWVLEDDDVQNFPCMLDVPDLKKLTVVLTLKQGLNIPASFSL